MSMFGKSSSETSQNPAETAMQANPVKTNNQPESGEIIAFVGEEVTFKGTIRYQGTVRVDGKLEGEIYTDGNLIIGQKAVIAAKIQAGTLTCQGRITGDVEAKHQVKLLTPAVFDGSITTPSISIDEGVLFNGTCHMPKPTNEESKAKGTKLVMEVEEAVKVK
jgi:cytoskeletal protein CcmA (bactofilin family)